MVKSDAEAVDLRQYWCLFVVDSIPSEHIHKHMCVFRLGIWYSFCGSFIRYGQEVSAAFE